MSETNCICGHSRDSHVNREGRCVYTVCNAKCPFYEPADRPADTADAIRPDLLPCPFCGAIPTYNDDDEEGLFVVTCSNEVCILGNMAITKGWWNTRANGQAAMQLELSSAQQQLVYLWNENGSCPCGARRESPNTHPHGPGCPTYIALAKAKGVVGEGKQEEKNAGA